MGNRMNCLGKVCSTTVCCTSQKNNSFYDAKSFANRRRRISGSLPQSYQNPDMKQTMDTVLRDTIISDDEKIENNFNDFLERDMQSEIEEGINLFDYVAQTCGPKAHENFSKQVDLRSI